MRSGVRERIRVRAGRFRLDGGEALRALSMGKST